MPGAPAPARGELIEELRRAYHEAIRQADADQKPREAASYRENLAILDHASHPAATATPPSPPADMPSPPQALAGTPTPAPPAAPDEPKPELVAPLTVAATPTPQDAAVKPISLPQAAPEPAAAPTPTPKMDLETGDAAFRAKRFDEAGRIYATLARAGTLPAVRRDAWAYCRMVAVIDRLNAQNQTGADWEAIRAEVDQIRRLNPGNWYAEYLRNLVAERAAQTRPPAGNGNGNGNRVVLRGGSPDDGAVRSRRRQFIAPATVPVSAPANGPVRPAGTPASSWQVWETPNFRVYHANLALAQRVGQIAETTRTEQTRRWGSPAQGQTWSPRCELYLYPTAAVFHERTGQPPEAPGSRPWRSIAAG